MKTIGRAREPEQKAKRRDTIVSAAAAMWHETGIYDAFTMSALAERTGLAKGTLYLYFKTKEEVFLALLESELALWFAHVGDRIERLRAPLSPERFATILSDSLKGRESFVRLFALLESVIERGLDIEGARAFKLGLDQGLRALSDRVAAAFGAPMRSDDAYALLLHTRALMCGLWTMSAPTPTVAAVLRADPALARFAIDFYPALVRGARALAYGFCHEKETK